jgi:hypothetical protein
MSDNIVMASTEKISQLRKRFVAELRNTEGELSRELSNVRQEIAKLVTAKPRGQARNSSASDSKTVSILSGKTCPKCGKKGHDMRWHRWNDRKKSAHNGRRKVA